MTSPKKIIGIDIDDVLIDFNSSIIQFHNQTYQTNFKLADIVQFEFEKLWNCSTEEVFHRVNTFYNSPLHLKIKPVKGAITALNQLSREHQIIAISARPTTTASLTKKLLDNYFKDNISKIVLTNAFSLTGRRQTKSEVCLKMGVSILIDDGLHNVLECSQKNIQSILLKRPWNQTLTSEDLKSKGIYTANDWPEILKLIKLMR